MNYEPTTINHTAHTSPNPEFSLNSVTIINDFYNFVVIQKRMTIQI